jgi:hypothetical protein
LLNVMPNGEIYPYPSMMYAPRRGSPNAALFAGGNSYGGRTLDDEASAQQA